MKQGIERAHALWPGVMVAAVVALAALFVSAHHGAPVMLMALLLGMALNFLSQEGRCVAGIDFTARQVLRWGVALLGLKITVTQVGALGWPVLGAVVLAVGATIACGMVLARVLGFKPFFGLLSGGAVGICGASAAMAIAAMFPQHPQRERATLFVVVSVSTLSTAAMVLYPLLMPWLGLEGVGAGIYLGGTIHDVAQVVGAGYSMGTDSGDTATVVKLLRVAMLVPVLVLAGWMTLALQSGVSPASESTASSHKRPPLLPGFAVVFVVLLLIRSLGVLPGWVLSGGDALSRICLVGAMAAIGMKTHLKDVLSVGWKPVLLVVLETVFLAAGFYALMRWLVV